MAGTHEAKNRSKNSGQMVAAIVATVVAAVIIFGGGAYLFTRIFTGSFMTYDEANTVQLVESNYKNTIEVQGSIKATSSETVTPEVNGTVNKLEVKEGDKVEQGDVLFTMKNATLTKAVEVAEKSYSLASESQKKAQAAYDKATGRVNDAKDGRDAAEKRARKLYDQRVAAAQEEAEDVTEELTTEEIEDGETPTTETTTTEVDVPEFSFDSSPYDTAIEIAEDSQSAAKDTLDEADRDLQDAKDAYDDAQKKVEQLTVVAPRAGTIAELKVEKGTKIKASKGKSVLRIVDLDTLVGAVEVPEGSVNSVGVGQECVVTVGKGTEATKVNASVYKISETPLKNPTTTDAGTMYGVQLTLDDSAKKAKYGMNIQAAIELRDFGTVFYVPAKAVSENGTGAYVEVVYNDNTTKEHGVTVLDTTDDGQVVIQGNTLTKEMRIRSDLS